MGKSVRKIGMALVAFALMFQIVALPVQSATGVAAMTVADRATTDGPHDGHPV